MPTPKPNEKESDYISRCVKEVMAEGATQEQALGKCYGMWKGSKDSVSDAIRGLPRFMKDSALSSALEKQGMAKGKSSRDYPPLELAIGIVTEMKEHTRDVAAAGRIAMAHLEENPHYYTQVLLPAEKKAVDE